MVKRDVKQMKIIDIKPRFQRSIAELQIDDKIPFNKNDFNVNILPQSIIQVTGNIQKFEFLQQGRCNLVLLLHCKNKKFVLKIANGQYRTQELLLEHEILEALKKADKSLAVPYSYGFFQHEELSFQIQEYICGEPLNQAFTQTLDHNYKLLMFKDTGKALASIHDFGLNNLSWKEWLEGQLAIAEKNLKDGILDLDEFIDTESPERVLEWLKNNKPTPGKISLLHGDYRPKNLLWNENRVTGIIDWGFGDIGDPYYDLAIVYYYLKTEEQKKAFFEGYGLKENYCKDRIYYYDVLSKFINI